MTATKRLRIGVVASNRHPIAEPFAGGMESHTWTLARGLSGRGHAVRVFAGAGSDPSLGHVQVLDDSPLRLTADARGDVSMPAESFMRDHHAYQRLMLRLAADPDVDVVIGGEQREIEGTFDSPEYVMDAATLGVRKGWIVIGHNMSEESGMQEMADWLRPIVPEVKVQHVRAGSVYWVPK